MSNRQVRRSSRFDRQDLWLSAAILLLAFFVRAHAVQALPPFNDESLHIRRAEQIYTFTDRNLNLTLGKLLSYYWIGLFQPERLDAIFVGRTASALFALFGLAAAYGAARLLFGRAAAIIALTFAAFSPFMIFFDRLALSDPLTAALGMLVVWASVRMMRRPRCGPLCPAGILTGVFCGLALISKLIGLPFVGVPLAAVLAFGQGPPPAGKTIRQVRAWVVERLRIHRDLLLSVYGAFCVVMLPFAWHVADRLVTGKYLNVVNNNLINGAAEEKSPLQITTDNLEALWNANRVLHGPVLWLLVLAAGAFVLWKRPREGAFLLSASLLPWSMSILLAAELSTRYLTLGVLPSLAVLSGGLSIAGRRRRWFRLGVAGLMAAWMGGFALPFIRDAWFDPTRLALPDRDRWEYFENFASGYALVDAARDMATLPRSEPDGRVAVIGLVGSCHQLRLYLDEHGPVKLECPFFGWQGEFMQDVADLVDRRLAEESIVFLLVEPDLRFTDLSTLRIRWELVKRYPRPFDGMAVELWRIYPESDTE